MVIWYPKCIRCRTRERPHGNGIPGQFGKGDRHQTRVQSVNFYSLMILQETISRNFILDWRSGRLTEENDIYAKTWKNKLEFSGLGEKFV